MPILYIDEGKPVLVSVAGSRDITYELPMGTRDKTLHVGYVKIIPQPQHRPGQITDLMRVDVLGAPFGGHTLDINLEKPTLMPLIAGTYRLAHFLSLTSTEGARTNQTRTFTIEPGKTIEIEQPVFFSEKKFSAFRKRVEPDAVDTPSDATDADRQGELGRTALQSGDRTL
jgi:hypothetical protein